MTSDSTLHLDGVLASTERHGTWDVPRRIVLYRRMGSVKLNFTAAALPPGGVVVEVDLIGGSLEMRVPEDAHVADSVSMTLASYQDHRRTPASGGPHFEVHGRAIWCSIEVRGPRTEKRVAAQALLRRVAGR